MADEIARGIKTLGEVEAYSLKMLIYSLSKDLDESVKINYAGQVIDNSVFFKDEIEIIARQLLLTLKRDIPYTCMWSFSKKGKLKLKIHYADNKEFNDAKNSAKNVLIPESKHD